MPSVGSSPPVPTAHSAVDARDVRTARGDHTSLESEDPGAADVGVVPAGMDRSPAPSPGPTREAPCTQHPSLPSEEGESGEFSLQGVSPPLDGPEGNPSDMHGDPLTGSKYARWRL